jgi:hypothetical protein
MITVARLWAGRRAFYFRQGEEPFISYHGWTHSAMQHTQTHVQRLSGHFPGAKADGVEICEVKKHWSCTFNNLRGSMYVFSFDKVREEMKHDYG